MIASSTSRRRFAPSHVRHVTLVALLALASLPAPSFAITLSQVDPDVFALPPFGWFVVTDVAGLGVFAGTDGTDGELYVFDPLDPAAGTTKIDINPTGSAFASTTLITEAAGRALFVADDGAGKELHVVDPHDPAAGSMKVDLGPGGRIVGITDVAGMALITNEHSSSEKQLHLLDPLNPADGAIMIDLDPSGVYKIGSVTEVAGLAVFNGGPVGTSSNSLHIVDPLDPGAGATNAGHWMYSSVTDVAGFAVFYANASHPVGIEPFIVDPHDPAAGAARININTNPGGHSWLDQTIIVDVAGRALVAAEDGGGDDEPFIFDPHDPSAGATKIDVHPTSSSLDWSNPMWFAEVAGLAVFGAASPGDGSDWDEELRIVDPRDPAAGFVTVNVDPTGSSRPYVLTDVGGRAVFRADDGTDTEVRVVDPRRPAAGAFKVDIHPTGSSNVREIATVAGRAVITADAGAGHTLFVLGFDEHWLSEASGSWDDATQWDDDSLPVFVDDVLITPDHGLTVTGPAADTEVFTLTVGAQIGGTATLELADGILSAHTATILSAGRLSGRGTLITDAESVTSHGTIDLAEGLQLVGGPVHNHGLILGGTGQIDAALHNAADGEVRALTGERILVSQGGGTNDGDINLLGGTVEIVGDLTNNAEGRINGRGVLITGSGLVNEGVVNLSGVTEQPDGTIDVLGNVEQPGDGQGGPGTGTMIVTGNTRVNFYDDVTNHGELRVTQGSAIVVFGDYVGSQGTTGSGDVFLEGLVSIGNSAAAVVFDNDVTLGPGARLLLELAGTAPGDDYDRFIVAGAMRPGGHLEIRLLHDFIPILGNTFDLLDFGSVDGRFETITVPALPDGLRFDTSALLSTGIITIVPEPPVVTLALVLAILLCRRSARVRTRGLAP